MAEWILTLLRAAGLFLLTLILVRVIGKRLSSPLNFFELVTAITIGVIIALLSVNIIPNSVNGYMALGIWTIFPAFLYLLSIKYKAIRDMVQSKETILINHGKVLEDKLMEVRYTPEDLLSQLRKKNVFNLNDVEFAVMESTGEISVLLKKDKQAITAKSIKLPIEMESVPQTVILDGIIMDEGMTSLGLNRDWLHTQLEEVGVAPENVFIGQVDSGGQLYLDLFDDTVLIQTPKTKELAYATLKKCQADSELYALGTKETKAKDIYSTCAKILLDITKDLEPWLTR